MAEHYQFTGGQYQPVEQIDVLPEQQAVNAKIERSEAEYFDSLRKNDRDRVNDTIDFYKKLGLVSEKGAQLAKKLDEDQDKRDQAAGAIAAINSPIDYNGLQALLNEEKNIDQQDLELAKIGNSVENETGSYILSSEIRGLSNRAQYYFVKDTLLREAKDYKQFKLTARDKVYITIDTGDGDQLVSYGKIEGVETRQPQNSAEADALDAKIRAEFVSRFAGINKILLQQTVKAEIDRVDTADKSQRDTEFETLAKERDAFIQRESIITNIRAANPENARKVLDHEVAILAATEFEGDMSLARIKMGNLLVNMVEKKEITLFEALSLVSHKTAYRGSNKPEDMTIFKEWKDLESRLMKANTTNMQEEEDNTKNAMLAEIEEFKKIENPTIETRADFIRGLSLRYPGVAIPEEGYNIVYGYIDDDAMRQKLDRVLKANKGVIPEIYLEGASPTIYKEYSDKIVRNDQAEVGYVSEFSISTQTFIKNRVANGVELELGEGKATTLEYDVLLQNASAEFVDDYNAKLREVGDPDAALLYAKAELVKNMDDEDYRTKYSRFVGVGDDTNKQNTLTKALELIKPSSGNWRTVKLPVTDEDLLELKNWAEGGGKGPVPSYYAALGFRNGIYAKELASAQASLHGYKAPEVDTKALEKIPPSVLQLLIKNPTPVKHEVAKVTYEDTLEENIDNEEYVKQWVKKTNLRPELLWF